MGKLNDNSKRIFLAIGSLMGWFTILVQFYIHVENRTSSVPESIIRFFSYFTILSNILVALSFSVFSFKPHSLWRRFFSDIQTLTAVTVYITIVGIVYNTILRSLWSPQGLQRVVDELLHLIIPIYFVTYWALFVVKRGLNWKSIFPWLIFPAVYLVFILIRGTFSAYYPYPFLDVNKLGYVKVGFNCVGLLAGFSVISLLFVTISKIVISNFSEKNG